MGYAKSPLRYPGGKQKLSPFIGEILVKNNLLGGHYVEPYAGGAGVAINLLIENLVSNIHLNDSDIGIYAFWHSVLYRTQELCEKILTASLTVDEWLLRKAIVKQANKDNLLELGYSVFYLNRCNRSGVLSAGVIGGLKQDGNYKMDARFSRNDLIRRIKLIARFRDYIHLTNFDAEYYITNYIPNLPDNTLIYLDPPYYEKGSILYLNSYNKTDHERISDVIQNEIQHKWVLSYDGVIDIIRLYEKRRHFLYDLQYSAGKSYKGKEIFIFSDIINIPEKCTLSQIDTGLKNIVSY